MRTLEKLLLTILSGISLTASAADAPAVPLDAARSAALLECAIPLTAARDNLEAHGYAIAPGATAEGFATAYKMSDKDSERRLLGSLSVERARQYRVAAAAGGIRFAPRHRETVLATGVLGRRNDEVREYDLPLTEAMLDTLKDMRREVCAGTAPEAKSNPETELYIIDRCKAGDDRACKLLRLR